MAGFADTLRGDGLVRVQRALVGLERDPQQLARARVRFDDSPPPYTSDRSGTTTLSQSPNPPSEEQRRHQERRMQLAEEADASKPSKQFSAQVEEERRRIWKADPVLGWRFMPPGNTFQDIASENVKKRWVEQGIWSSKWNQFAYGRWKHEEPLELESESGTDSEVGPLPLFSVFPMPQPKSRPPKSDDEKRQIAEQRVIQQREREASRPYYQFVYQISKESERIQDDSASGIGADAADINTRAYENVKNTWAKRKIWNRRWGILPGMSWKHEEPLEEEAAVGPAPVPVNPLVNDSHEAGKAPVKRLFGSPPVESKYRQASAELNSSQQGPSADINSAGLENGNVEYSSSTSNSSSPNLGKWVIRPTTAKVLLPNKRKAPYKDVQPTNTFLGPAHSSNVSKAAGKGKGPQRRLNIPQKTFSDGLLFSSGVGAAEPQPSPPPDRVTPRRSKRIQPPVSSVPKDPATADSAEASKCAVRSKPERKVASNPTARSSAKPQGVSKRQPAKTARGKARKQ